MSRVFGDKFEGMMVLQERIELSASPLPSKRTTGYFLNKINKTERAPPKYGDAPCKINSSGTASYRVVSSAAPTIDTRT
jgi:hypothetical protein